jgi:predicted Zn finger-like uncharacterized protein
MSLAARCPWCETVFRLTEGQVSAKGGMARCGICSHTFNALDALLSDSAVAALERSAQARKDSEEASFKKTDPLGKQRELILDGKPLAPLKTDSPMSSAPASSFATSPTSAAYVPEAEAKPEAPPPDLVTPAAPAPASPLSSLRLPAFLMGNRQIAPDPAPTQTTNPSSGEAMASPASAVADVAGPGAPVQEGPEAEPPAKSPSAARTPAPPPAATPPAVAPPVPVAPRTLATPTPAAGQVFVPRASNTSPTAAIAPAPQPEPPAPVAAPAPAMPVVTEEVIANYEVALPDYDAAAVEPAAQKDEAEPAASATGISEQIDQLQAALAVADERPSPSALTLAELRPPKSLASPSRVELTRDNERLGPSTFQPSFLTSDEESPGWRRLRAFFMLMLCLIAALAAAGQAAYWWRTDLAVKVPALKPYLELACARLHCEVLPPSQIEQLSIESSELVAAPGAQNTLAFTALLRNHSSTVVAYPAIEVTLTDARDRAVLRRDFLPADYLNDSAGQRQRSGIAPNSEFTIKLTFNTSGVATTGYRAAIFYP